MIFYDSHFHLVPFLCREKELSSEKLLDGDSIPKNVWGVSCALDVDEFARMENLCRQREGVLMSFGIHPQNPDKNLLPFLESLLSEKRIDAVGEIGFDFFVNSDRENAQSQEEVWSGCIDLALKYQRTAIIHNRKALDMMFRYSNQLSGLPSVVFHSFPFGSREALSLLDKGVDGYFSFGKTLLRGSRKNMECLKNLPQDRILMETDAPFQNLKGEEMTIPSDIERVYKMAADVCSVTLEDFASRVEINFKTCFNLP